MNINVFIKTSNISNNSFNIPDFPDIPGVTETKKPTLECFLALANEIEAFEERAAIIEFEGDKTRNEAEKLAYESLIKRLVSNQGYSWLVFNKYFCKIH